MEQLFSYKLFEIGYGLLAPSVGQTSIFLGPVFCKRFYIYLAIYENKNGGVKGSNGGHFLGLWKVTLLLYLKSQKARNYANVCCKNYYKESPFR